MRIMAAFLHLLLCAWSNYHACYHGIVVSIITIQSLYARKYIAEFVSIWRCPIKGEARMSA